MTVGRNDDFSALTSALADARAGAGSMVILAGDAGVGKTRIARDIARAAAERGMTTLAGGCAEAELSLPYLPFLEAIGNHLTTVDTADLRERLGPPARELARLFPQLRIEASPLDPSDPIQSKLRLFESIVAVLDLASREGGALLLIEDLHWADESTRELLDYLVRRIRVQRLLVVATCRTDEIDRRHPLATSIARWERGGVRLQRLGPLDPDQVGEMLAAIMGVPAIAADVMDFFHNRSEGNPFALEEILKEALDRGGLDPRAATRLDLTSAQARLPRTVRDTVTRRVERLAWGTGEVVRAGAVLGRSFHYHTLQQTSDQSEADVHEALRVCVDQQLMEEDPASPEKYRFRHALTQAAIYEELLAPERENLHRRAALVLRADPTANPIELLRHLLAARMWTEAVPLAIDASRQAMAAHAYRDAAGLLERILPFVTDPARGELMVQLGQALHLAGDAAGGERNLKDGVALMLAAGNRSGAASGRLWLGRCHWERARPDLAKAEYERARDDLQDGGPSEDLALSYVRLASLAVFDLDGQRAVDLAEHAIEIAELAGATAPRIWAYNFLGLGLVQLRRVDEGLASLEASYQDAAARGLNVIAANALYNDIQVRIQHLRPLEAVDRLRILESLQAGSMGSLQSLRAAGQVHLWGLGNPGQALSAFQSASTLAREGDAHYWEMWLRPHMAVALAQLDRLG
ncbi:MAG TPA: AAA family ATPase, partial [Candidatus Dormibacteraeota bacterium]|nr:AAA family ATPase [Candidatus Dormibacteraeota bacterium]